MEGVNLWALGGVGLAAGLFGSMMGLGGGVFLVPLLTLLLHLPIHTAIGTSLISVAATSIAATSLYTKARLTNIPLAVLLETPTVFGAITGAFLAAFLASPVLAAVFGILLIYVAYSLISRRHLVGDEVLAEETPDNLDSPCPGSKNSLATSYYDRCLDRMVSYGITHVPHGMGISFFAGAISGMLGIGGGILKIPTMHLVMGVPMRAAIATSSFMIGITAIASAPVYFYHGFVPPFIAAPTIIGTFLGASLGSELAQRTRVTILRYALAICMFIIAGLMLLRGINVGFMD